MRRRATKQGTVTRRTALSMLSGLAGAATMRSGWAAADGDVSDLVIVGAGTAGLVAAIFAAERGLRVTVLEKANQVGGTLWFSGGQMSAAGTRLQRSKGITDSAQQHYDDVMRISRGTADSTLVRLATSNAGATLDWLESKGLQFGAEYPVPATGHEPYSAARVWGSPERGISIVKVLQRALAAAGSNLSILTQIEAMELMFDSRRQVRGVIGRGADGKRRDFGARNVVLTSGGYMANPALFAELNGLPMHRQAGWPMNTGIGIELARSAGGYVRGRENYLCDFGSIPADDKTPSPELARSIHHPQRRLPWEIIVNARGERFVREDEPSVDARERLLLKQPDHRYWLVFDHRILQSAPPLINAAPPASAQWGPKELESAFGKYASFVQATSLGELAQRAGIDAAGLQRSVDEYNRLQSGGADPLGRKHRPLPLLQAPFYAIRHQGGSLIAMAGVAVDGKLRVKRSDGSAIQGLYAAGEMLGNCQLSGQAFCSGMSVTPALTFGRLLGLSVAG